MSGGVDQNMGKSLQYHCAFISTDYITALWIGLVYAFISALTHSALTIWQDYFDWLVYFSRPKYWTGFNVHAAHSALSKPTIRHQNHTSKSSFLVRLEIELKAQGGWNLYSCVGRRPYAAYHCHHDRNYHSYSSVFGPCELCFRASMMNVFSSSRQRRKGAWIVIGSTRYARPGLTA